MKVAIIQCADTGPVESLVDMLSAVDYWCHLPDRKVLEELRKAGCDTVLSNEDLCRGMGYEPPTYNGKPIPTAGLGEMKTADLYVDVKGHRNAPRVIARWPNLKGKVLWYRINGGQPEHVVNASGDHGDEVNPPCPVITPNQWYKFWPENGQTLESYRRSYWMWPPFVKFSEYGHPRPMSTPTANKSKCRYDSPICLIHNVNGWGYRDLVVPLRELGVRVYGAGSPDGLINHALVPTRLSSTLAYVHTKSNDAPGYSLYEALAAGCPIILPRRMIWRCRMESLFLPGVNCLVFDRETHDPLSAEEVRICTREIEDGLRQLSDPAENQRIGNAGREQLKKVMWDRKNPEDVQTLKDFMERNFP